MTNNLQDVEDLARVNLPLAHYDFFAGGAQDEITLWENRSAFERVLFQPRVLTGQIDTSTSIDLLGSHLHSPIILSPTAFHQLAHPEGELASAKAANAFGTIMIVSMASTTSIEAIASVGKTQEEKKQFWFQLYVQPDREFTRDLIHRVESAGCGALVITVDSPVFGMRERDKKNEFNDLPQGMEPVHLRSKKDGMLHSIEFNPALSWSDLDWLRKQTSLPIVLKGVMHPSDAKQAVMMGVDAIMVSNHGGRQLDSSAATIDVLPTIADAIGYDLPIILDGGVRRGSDVVKAIASGATSVGIGRPILWGLAAAGQEGVESVLTILQKELLNSLSLCGASLENLSGDILFQAGPSL